MFKIRRKKSTSHVIRVEEIQLNDRMLCNGRIGEVRFIGRGDTMTTIVLAEIDKPAPFAWAQTEDLYNEMKVLVERV